jgi:hypothetical protein
MSWLLCHPQKGRPLGKVMKMSVRWETFLFGIFAFPFLLGEHNECLIFACLFPYLQLQTQFWREFGNTQNCANHEYFACFLSYLLTYTHQHYISFVVFQDHHWLFSGFIRIQCLSSNLSPLATTPLAAQLCTLEISSFIPKSLELGNGNADPQNRDWGGRC